MSAHLSPRTQGVLDFLRQYRVEYGYAPSRRDIVAGCGLSSSSVAHGHILRLRNAGYLGFTEGIARSIVLLEPEAT